MRSSCASPFWQLDALQDGRLAAKRLDDELGRLHAGEVLLTYNEVTIANGKAAPQSRLHIVRTQGLELVFDAPGHHVLVARQKVHAPDSIVGEVLFDVGKARDRLALGKVFAAPELGVLE